VILSDAYRHTFYDYTADGELCHNITVRSVGFAIDGDRDLFEVYQISPESFLVAQTIIQPCLYGCYYAELELKKIGPDRKSQSGNWKVHIPDASSVYHVVLCSVFICFVIYAKEVISQIYFTRHTRICQLAQLQ